MPECTLLCKPYKLVLSWVRIPPYAQSVSPGGAEFVLYGRNGICKVKLAYARTFYLMFSLLARSSSPCSCKPTQRPCLRTDTLLTREVPKSIFAPIIGHSSVQPPLLIAKTVKGVFAMCFVFKSPRKELSKQLAKAFPLQLASDVKVVCNALLHLDEKRGYEFYYDHTSTWLLPTGERVTVPYRLYIRDELKPLTRLTGEQQIIYHCICSRSYDGYVRQKHIQALLAADLPEWALPYVIKVCDEYVVEILQLVYTSLARRDCTAYKRICALNLDYVKLGHSRMISYWNEYYRWDYYRYRDYIGKKLYAECFGYGKTGQKFIEL